MKKIMFINTLLLILCILLIITNKSVIVVCGNEVNEIDAVMDEPKEDKIDDATRELIERVVAAEARGETLEGMIAVAQVIKDRGDLWELSYAQICLEKGQFAKPYEGTISYEVEEAVSLVFDYGVRAEPEYMTHFYDHTLIDPPYWTEGKRLVTKIGSHSFYF